MVDRLVAWLVSVLLVALLRPMPDIVAQAHRAVTDKLAAGDYRLVDDIEFILVGRKILERAISIHGFSSSTCRSRNRGKAPDRERS